MNKINAWIKLTSEFPRFLKPFSTHPFYVLLYVGWDKTFRTVKSLTATCNSSSVLPTLDYRVSKKTDHMRSAVFVSVGRWLVVASHLSEIKLFSSLMSRWTCPHPVGDPEENLPTMLKLIDFLSWNWSLEWLYNISTCGEPDKCGMHPSFCWQKQLRPAWIPRVASAG